MTMALIWSIQCIVAVSLVPSGMVGNLSSKEARVVVDTVEAAVVVEVALVVEANVVVVADDDDDDDDGL